MKTVLSLIAFSAAGLLCGTVRLMADDDGQQPSYIVRDSEGTMYYDPPSLWRRPVYPYSAPWNGPPVAPYGWRPLPPYGFGSPYYNGYNDPYYQTYGPGVQEFLDFGGADFYGW